MCLSKSSVAAFNIFKLSPIRIIRARFGWLRSLIWNFWACVCVSIVLISMNNADWQPDYDYLDIDMTLPDATVSSNGNRLCRSNATLRDYTDIASAIGHLPDSSHGILIEWSPVPLDEVMRYDIGPVDKHVKLWQVYILQVSYFDGATFSSIIAVSSSTSITWLSLAFCFLMMISI